MKSKYKKAKLKKILKKIKQKRKKEKRLSRGLFSLVAYGASDVYFELYSTQDLLYGDEKNIFYEKLDDLTHMNNITYIDDLPLKISYRKIDCYRCDSHIKPGEEYSFCTWCKIYTCINRKDYCKEFSNALCPRCRRDTKFYLRFLLEPQ